MTNNNDDNILKMTDWFTKGVTYLESKRKDKTKAKITDQSHAFPQIYDFKRENSQIYGM